MAALTDSGGNQPRTAVRIDLLATTLHEKMKRLGLLRRRPHTLETTSSAEAAARPGVTEMAVSREGREALASSRASASFFEEPAGPRGFALPLGALDPTRRPAARCD